MNAITYITKIAEISNILPESRCKIENLQPKSIKNLFQIARINMMPAIEEKP
jgi:hypothetical protein